jgi:hypothetical protein
VRAPRPSLLDALGRAALPVLKTWGRQALSAVAPRLADEEKRQQVYREFGLVAREAARVATQWYLALLDAIKHGPVEHVDEEPEGDIPVAGSAVNLDENVPWWWPLIRARGPQPESGPVMVQIMCLLGQRATLSFETGVTSHTFAQNVRAMISERNARLIAAWVDADEARKIFDKLDPSHTWLAPEKRAWLAEAWDDLLKGDGVSS